MKNLDVGFLNNPDALESINYEVPGIYKLLTSCTDGTGTRRSTSCGPDTGSAHRRHC